ncbi:phosphonoacetaldehyde hydrolase [Candidatus Gracilibacteria bacterium]|nr:phosphonoacetaldehyde hydrolase [Candidatus Gracilibacteria bacterium]
MALNHRPRYCGPLRAIIFDWAGTTVDHGSLAPVAVFIEVFARRGVHVSAEQARAPMGLAKVDHIRVLAALPTVAEQWRQRHGRAWNEIDISAMYAESIGLQVACVAEYATLIPGALSTVEHCRARGMGIGSSTGYSRTIMQVLAPAAAEQGYCPDALVCTSDVPAGRPAPWMALQNAMQLGIYPLAAAVKVGDTVPDIAEGLNAGMWTIGLSRSGSALGLSYDDALALPAHELHLRLGAISAELYTAGAHFVVESIAEIPAVLDIIDECLRRGEAP